MRKVTKLFNTRATSIDDVAKTATFAISTNQKDRYGEIVDQRSWDFKDYLANPIFLWGHDPSEPENILGQCIDLAISEDGSQTIGTYHFDTDINPKADLVFNQVKRGSLRTVSVGFMTGREEIKDGTPLLLDNTLLETSIAPIPANPGAVALAFKAGDLNKKDAQWLMDSMRKETAYLEEQMKESDNTKENPMNDKLANQLSALLGAVTSLATAQAETNKSLAALTTNKKGAVADILNADNSWQVDDEKWMNMSVVSDMYYAFCEAYFYTATPADGFNTLLQEFIELVTSVLDGSYSDETEGSGSVSKALKTIDKAHVKEVAGSFFKKKSTDEEEQPVADPEKGTPAATTTPPAPKETDQDDDTQVTDDEDKADGKKKPADDVAKGGGNDQPGATEDAELDLDAELTPELKKQIDESLETTTA